MYVCVCMYVCVFTWAYVCMYACMHVCMYARTHARMHACMHLCISVSIYLCVYMCDLCNHDSGQPCRDGIDQTDCPLGRPTSIYQLSVEGSFVKPTHT